MNDLIKHIETTIDYDSQRIESLYYYTIEDVLPKLEVNLQKLTSI